MLSCVRRPSATCVRANTWRSRFASASALSVRVELRSFSMNQ